MNASNPLLAVVLGVAVLAGCAASAPSPVLLSLPAAVMAGTPSPAPTDATAARVLAVRRVSIPEYLVARRVRYRADASTLAEWPNTFWAERIEIGVSREFVAALRQQLPEWALCESTCAELGAGPTLQVDLLPMDFVRGTQTLQARARVTVTVTASGAGAAPRVLHAREWAYALPAIADTPQAHAQAVTELLRQVAQATAPLIRDARP